MANARCLQDKILKKPLNNALLLYKRLYLELTSNNHICIHFQSQTTLRNSNVHTHSNTVTYVAILLMLIRCLLPIRYVTR